MTDIDLLAERGSSALRAILARLATLTLGLVGGTLVIGIATYASGRLAFDAGSSWNWLGVIICVIPAFAAWLAAWRIWRVRRRAPQALLDLRDVLKDQELRSRMGTLIDYDTQQPIVSSSKSLYGVYSQVKTHNADWPALADSLKAITTVPGLVALAIVGTVGVGLLGGFLLLVGLLS